MRYHVICPNKSWRSGWEVLDSADSEPQAAFLAAKLREFKPGLQVVDDDTAELMGIFLPR